MPQFIRILVFLNYLYVLFSPSPRTNQQQEEPHFLLQVFTWHFPSFHGGAIKSALHRGWGCTGSTWQIEICGLWNLAPRLGWVVLNIDHPPLCQKKSMVICQASFCIFFWGWISRNILKMPKLAGFWVWRDLYGKKDSDHQNVLDVFFFRWNWPQFKTGVFKVNRKNQLKHEMSPNNSELDVQKSMAISSWVVLPKDIFLISTLGNWSNLTSIFRNGLKPPSCNLYGDKFMKWINWLDLIWWSQRRFALMSPSGECTC